MKSSRRGAATSVVEVSNIGKLGLWLLLDNKEYFLPYEEYPWFRSARIDEILNVVLLHNEHLHWPDLDVDLYVESLEHPDAFPLIYAERAAPAKGRAKPRKQRVSGRL